MTLREIIRTLSVFDEKGTIYAAEPWSGNSAAVAAREPEAGGLPGEAAQHGLSYFLEINSSREFLEDWSAYLRYEPDLEQKVDRLVRYAIDDA